MTKSEWMMKWWGGRRRYRQTGVYNDPISPCFALFFIASTILNLLVTVLSCSPRSATPLLCSLSAIVTDQSQAKHIPLHPPLTAPLLQDPSVARNYHTRRLRKDPPSNQHRARLPTMDAAVAPLVSQLLPETADAWREPIHIYVACGEPRLAL